MKLLMLSFGVIMAQFAITQCAAQSQPFTVKNDIEMTRFSDPHPLPGVVGIGSESAQCSPNGRHFAVITTKGILKADRLESKISIIDTVAVIAALNSPTTRLVNPHVIATLVSFPHHQEPTAYGSVITDLRWCPDSTCVYYKGEGLDGNYRLYRAEINMVSTHVLTPADTSVTLYDVAGNTIVYRANEGSGAHATPGEPINADALAVTGYRLMDILFSREMEDIYAPQTSTLHIIRKVQGIYTNTTVPNSSIRELAPHSSNPFIPFSLSPNGRRLIELSPVASVPLSWESYEPAKVFEHLRYRSNDPQLTNDTNEMRPRRYMLEDLDTGKKRPLIDAPNGFTLGYWEQNRVVWSRDGQRVLITNTLFPLAQTSSAVRAERIRPCLVASVETQTLEAHCLSFTKNDVYIVYLRLEKLLFGKDNDEVVLQADTSPHNNVVQTYRYRNGEWQIVAERSQDELLRATPAQSRGAGIDLQLIVRQTLNDPPTLWISDSSTGQSREAWDPNPQLAHTDLSQISVYHWKDKTGYEWTGGLVKPLDYVSGKRYPLVIQTHGFYDDLFMTDGSFPTAMAARPLASAGIMVLQIGETSLHTFNDAEAQGNLEGYRSAIEQLSQDGLVDVSRVGAVGFSWTCWYVENALIKAPKLFKAAIVADGVSHSYMEYHLFDVSDPILRGQDNRIMESEPFGAGLRRWVEMAPGFNLNEVQSPLRLEAMTPASLLSEWEIYASLHLQGKPVDFVYFPFGQHIHQKPLERFESQQGEVDWFRFWLQGYEDPDPTKTEQYQRWEHLRELKVAEDGGSAM